MRCDIKPVLMAMALLGSSTLASAQIIWDQTPTAMGGQWAGAYANTQSMQNYSDRAHFASNATVTGMDIYTFDYFAVVGGTVRIRIHTGAPNGSFLQFSETISIVDRDGVTGFGSSDPHLVRVHATFTNPVTMLAGTDYWIGMSGESGLLATPSDLGQMFVVPNGGFPATSPELDRRGGLYNGTTFLSYSTDANDVAFRLEGTLEAAAPIPEPETYAMLLAGLGLLGFAARRRKLKEAAAA